MFSERNYNKSTDLTHYRFLTSLADIPAAVPKIGKWKNSVFGQTLFKRLSIFPEKCLWEKPLYYSNFIPLYFDPNLRLILFNIKK